MKRGRVGRPKTRSSEQELDAIRRELLRFRYDPEFKGRGNRVSLRHLARLVGLPRSLLYEIMHRQLRFNPSPHLRRRLRYAIDLVLVHGLRWHRHKDRLWHAHMPHGGKLEIPLEMMPEQKFARPPPRRRSAHPRRVAA